MIFVYVLKIVETIISHIQAEETMESGEDVIESISEYSNKKKVSINEDIVEHIDGTVNESSSIVDQPLCDSSKD